MAGRDEGRGVSEVVGFIIIFGFLVVAFSLYQGVVVPDQNRVVEFDHNQAVQGQLQDLRNAIMSAAFGGVEQTVSVSLGADYPHRTLARNLGFSGGSLTTSSTGTGEIIIENAVAVDRYGETVDYWNGTRTHSFTSKEITYEPTYSRYTDAPRTSYENTFAYNDFGDGANLSITGQALIAGKRITIVSLVGTLSESGRDTVSVDPEAISASSERISIRNETHPINLTIPTRLSQSWWEEMLQDEMDDGYVVSVDDTGANQVSILLKSGTTYSLRMAKIGVGSSDRDEDVEYLTLVERPSTSVFNDTSHSITVQARDRFNNPVSGALVNASVGNPDATNNGSFTEWTINTGTDGEATFEYTANEPGRTDELWFNVTSGPDLPDHRTVRIDVDVRSSSGGGGSELETGGAINPSSEGSVTLQDALIDDQNCGSNCVNVTVENLDQNESQTITDMRFVFYSVYGQGQESATTPPPGSAKIDDHDDLLLVNRGDYNGLVDVEIPASSSAALELHFYRNEDGTTAHDVVQGDFFIIAVRIDGGEKTATYFVAPQDP